MIARIPGWRLERFPDGLAMHHPRGTNVAVVLYRERQRPLRRVADLVRTVLAGWPAYVAEVGPIERSVTADGEHAAVVTAVGTERGEVLQRDLGFVLTDEFYSVIAGTSRGDERAATSALVRELVRTDAHGLGVRRRRFEYEPPPGFQPRRRSLAVEWLAPLYPGDGTSIVVEPALPLAIAGVTSVAGDPDERRRLGYRVDVRNEPESFVTRHGLRGERLVADIEWPSQPAARHALVRLRDDRYVYRLELVCRWDDRWDEARSIFDRVVESVQPIPRPSSRPPALAHWGE